MSEHHSRNQDWKKIKEKISAWAKKSKNNPEKITPIFAHASVGSVFSKSNSMISILSSVGMDEYSYLVTLIKKNQKYLATFYTYLIENNTEVPLTVDQKTFNEYDYKHICEFVSIPHRLFKTKGSHKKVMTFKNTTMSESRFEKEIELWREKQT
tara:strand:+ start:2037 stop:2498 length:462 start_codon:yes stop_codon:yes gene_type:complete